MKHQTLFPAALAVAVLASTTIGVAAPAKSRNLTFEERVAAQRAIEQVYWNHRIWPKENPAPKPALAAVLSDKAIRARVEESLRKSNALEKYWHRPITSAQLQAELDRMASETRNPGVLKELFAALGNDPALIAETLARQSLADRLIRQWYAGDERFHGEIKEKAAAALARCRRVECMPSMGGEYRETTWKQLSEGNGVVEGAPHPDKVRLKDDEWRAHLARLSEILGGTSASLPLLQVSPLEESQEAFVVTAVLSQSKDEVRTAAVMWRKDSFEEWWEAKRAAVSPQVTTRRESFTLPQTSPSCAADTWNPIEGEVPVPTEHTGHTAVWTGTEMIVWGGNVFGFHLRTGACYNPATDTWTETSTGANVPEGRSSHTAVWTGTEMIVWGGYGSDFLHTGARYDPGADTWMPTSTGSTVPDGRLNHTAVWTGAEMIVWGGDAHEGIVYGIAVNSGGRYNPSTDTWTPTSKGANVPTARYWHTAIWSGAEMIVWGGYRNSPNTYLDTGARYVPATDTWMAMAANGPRSFHKAVWTGTEMIVWGGSDGVNRLSTGARYAPSTDAWTPTSDVNAPAGRISHTAVWTGNEMIVWGGDTNSGGTTNAGGRYDPSTDAWTPTSMGANVPVGRSDHTAVWTGTEMIVWGGQSDTELNTGGRYDPSTDTWIPTSTSGARLPRVGWNGTSAVWTGAELIVWGGIIGSYGVNTGGRYDPSTATWTPTSTAANVPVGRFEHVAVWTGTEMVVWGGHNGACTDCGDLLTSVGRYNPSTDTWAPTSGGGVGGNLGQTAVWTGKDMIVFGGGRITTTCYASGQDCEFGWCDPPVVDGGAAGRYDPATDTWTAISLGGNISPTGHSAVWTGTEMIVWGGSIADCVDQYGCYGTFSCTQQPLVGGSRYNLATDAWTTTSVGNVSGEGHTAVWTGSEMIVWGGGTNVGGRYDPATNAWTPTSMGTNVPAMRSGHTAVWTGNEMIVWGGGSNTGGRYDPAADAWTPTSTGTNVPAARSGHAALWTGSEMIVWGGGSIDGGLYCACPSGALVYRDADGDGFGDPGVIGTSCDGALPSGYVANASDCNDASVSVHPGAAESCNGVDDDCDGVVDNAAPPVPVTGVSMRSEAPVIQWSADAAAQTYDVVYGDVGLLRSSGGSFTAATQGCAAFHTTAASAGVNTTPDVGSAFWFLVRGDNCGGAGTYDGEAGQVGSRDAGIDASPLSCEPAACGDGVCNGSEDCSTCPSDCGACACSTDSECQPASCCNATSCITIWEPQSCNVSTCGDGCWICLSACACQAGQCVAIF